MWKIRVVCPPILRKHLFTTSTKTSFNSISVSMFQHPSRERAGEEREPLKLHTEVRVKEAPAFPEAFTNAPPDYFRRF